jgi:hypothetical protein
MAQSQQIAAEYTITTKINVPTPLAFKRACEEGTVPDGVYGPGTMRWATTAEMLRFGLSDIPLVHLDENGAVDCYVTETEACRSASAALTDAAFITTVINSDFRPEQTTIIIINMPTWQWRKRLNQ